MTEDEAIRKLQKASDTIERGVELMYSTYIKYGYTHKQAAYKVNKALRTWLMTT